jgi:hypothetical protein
LRLSTKKNTSTSKHLSPDSKKRFAVLPARPRPNTALNPAEKTSCQFLLDNPHGHTL